ncbi:MAG: hypothetical protein LHW46_09900 [Candidatus Cloacimonetes bacterium]|jgi:multidrug transporter EmrE-like cation transporter|nr:hypothetical protein [Candidatus Cloacimonadota bacterium]MDD2683035.1 hypothetical protein [Candidatus Cloacimonadota bacterium]
METIYQIFQLLGIGVLVFIGWVLYKRQRKLFIILAALIFLVLAGLIAWAYFFSSGS